MGFGTRLLPERSSSRSGGLGEAGAPLPPFALRGLFPGLVDVGLLFAVPSRAA